MTKVFVSYSRQDARIVTEITSSLQQRNLSTWVDHDSLTPGTPDWEDAIRRGIQQSTVVLYMGSPDARRSSNVRGELQVATRFNKPILPIWVAGDQWIDSVPLGYSMIQSIDARGQRLSQALDEIARAVSAPGSIPLNPDPRVATRAHSATIDRVTASPVDYRVGTPEVQVFFTVEASHVLRRTKAKAAAKPGIFTDVEGKGLNNVFQIFIDDQLKWEETLFTGKRTKVFVVEGIECIWTLNLPFFLSVYEDIRIDGKIAWSTK